MTKRLPPADAERKERTWPAIRQRITVDVTADDVALATPRDDANCPIGRAIERMYPGTAAMVDYEVTVWFALHERADGLYEDAETYEITKKADKLIKEYDAGGVPKPQRLILNHA